MLVLFCNDPLSPRAVEPMFEAERDAARAAGLETSLVGYEALVNDHDAAMAVRLVPESSEACEALYRGWMLKPEAYDRLHAALGARGVRLVHDPETYRNTHHLPGWYGALEGLTPRSTWLPWPASFDAVHEALAGFGDGPVVVKDYVKSRKHEWAEACFIPRASEREAVERVVRRFVELQAEDLNEGLVFREFVTLEQRGTHPQSGMPLAREYRMFFLDGRRIGPFGYWGPDEAPPAEALAFAEAAAKRVRARFFSMDIAPRREGGWLVVEIGDGQVSGLPDGANTASFYEGIRDQG